MYNDKKLKQFRRKLRKDETKAEKLLWRRLRNSQLGVRFRRQYSVGLFILDFYCPKYRLAIELDGGHQNLPEQSKHDQYRSIYLNNQDITVVRYPNSLVFMHLEEVLQDVINKLNFPSNLPKGETYTPSQSPPI